MELEEEIKKQIKSYYGNVLTAEIDINGTTKRFITGYKKENEIDKILSDTLCKNTEKLLYLDGTIKLVFDEKWLFEDIKNFIDKSLHSKTIIEAINNKKLKLCIETIHENDTEYIGQKGTKKYELNFNYLCYYKKLIQECLNEIGIIISNLNP